MLNIGEWDLPRIKKGCPLAEARGLVHTFPSESLGPQDVSREPRELTWLLFKVM